MVCLCRVALNLGPSAGSSSRSHSRAIPAERVRSMGRELPSAYRDRNDP